MTEQLQLTFLAGIQGITEFLPISSSAHLILIPKIFAWRDQGLAIDIALHAGSLFAIIFYLRADIARAITSLILLIRGKREDLFAWHLILASLPVIAVAAFIRELVALYLRAPLIIALCSIIFGILLYFIDRYAKNPEGASDDFKKMTVQSALIVGLFQVIALIPGVSRSGITITAARMLGFNRLQAARFSMLLAIPVIALSALATLIDYGLAQEGQQAFSLADFIYGFFASAIFSFLAVVLLMRWLKFRSFTPFIVYRILLGIVLVIIYI